MATSADDRKKIRRDRRDQLTAERAPRSWQRSWQIRFAHNRLAYCEAQYHKTGNPVFASAALAQVLRHKLALPAWLCTYWLESAEEITRLWFDPTKRPRKGEIDRKVAAALGFHRRGRSNEFTAPDQQAHEWMMARHVYDTHIRNRKNQSAGVEGPHDWASVFRDAAVWHPQHCPRANCRPSAKTMERCWYKHAKTIIPHRRIDRAPSRQIHQILPIK